MTSRCRCNSFTAPFRLAQVKGVHKVRHSKKSYSSIKILKNKYFPEEKCSILTELIFPELLVICPNRFSNLLESSGKMQTQFSKFRKVTRYPFQRACFCIWINDSRIVGRFLWTNAALNDNGVLIVSSSSPGLATDPKDKYNKDKIIDGLPDTYWHSEEALVNEGPSWVKYALNNPQTITQVTIGVRPGLCTYKKKII